MHRDQPADRRDRRSRPNCWSGCARRADSLRARPGPGPGDHAGPAGHPRAPRRRAGAHRPGPGRGRRRDHRRRAAGRGRAARTDATSSPRSSPSDPGQSLWRDEVFGPVVAAMTPADGFDEAVGLANDSRYGLSAAVFTTQPAAGPGVHRPGRGRRRSRSTCPRPAGTCTTRSAASATPDPRSRSRAPPGCASTPGSRRPRSGSHGDGHRRRRHRGGPRRAGRGPAPGPGAGARGGLREGAGRSPPHQSGHNSGVVHAGIYYLPGSAKATLCRRGVELLRAYCADRGLPWDARGQAGRRQGRGRDRAGCARSSAGRAANGVPGVRWLDAGGHPGAGTGRRRPGRAALAVHRHRRLPRHRPLASPTTSPRLGGQVLTGTPVSGVRRRSDDEVRGRRARRRRTGCPGWSSAPACRPTCSPTAAGDEAAPEIVPFRGEYLRLRPHARGRVRHLIYPVPDPAYPFLGVHLTPRIDGEVDIGPNAVLALAREGYRRRDVSAAQLSRLARSAAFHRLARSQLAGGPARDARVGVAAGLPRRGPRPTCPGWAPAT